MLNGVITLSRQRGSGGDTIAALVAQDLQIPLYDQQVLARAAEQAGVSQDFVAAAGDPARLRRPAAGDARPQRRVLAGHTRRPVAAAATGEPARDTRRPARQHRAGHPRLAERGPAVIVGHAAGQVALRDRPDVLRVFIHAPLEQRVQRMMTYGQLSRADAEQDVRQHDEDRTTFFHRNYDLDWYSLRLYDLTINAGGRQYADVAAEMCQVARERLG